MSLVLLNESGAVGAAFLGAREVGKTVRLQHSDFLSVLYNCADHPGGPSRELDLDASAIGLFAATTMVAFVRALAAYAA